MVKIPAARPVARVPRSRRDDRYHKGHPTPAKRASAGWVLSVEESTDSCTVLICEEEIPGVVYLYDVPPVGAIVEVESRGDLLVIVTQFEGPLPWLTLGPPAVQVVSRYDMDVPYQNFPGTFDSAYGSIVQSGSRQVAYGMNTAFGCPVTVKEIPACWACVWAHVNACEGAVGGSMWNDPTSDITWNGSGVCDPIVSTPSTAGSSDSGPTVSAIAIAGGNDMSARFVGASYHVDKTHLLSFAPGQDAWYGVPTPPSGYTLVWEDAAATLLSLEMALTEKTAAAPPSGVVDVRVYESGSFGQDGSGNWHFGAPPAGELVVESYTGGTGEWFEFDLPDGISRYVGVPQCVSEQTMGPTRSTEGTTTETMSPHLVFRLHWKPSRYKFVEI